MNSPENSSDCQQPCSCACCQQAAKIENRLSFMGDLVGSTNEQFQIGTSDNITRIDAKTFRLLEQKKWILTPQEAFELGFNRPSQSSLSKDTRFSQYIKAHQQQMREKDPEDDLGKEENKPCKRQCHAVITIEHDPASMQHQGEGQFEVTQRYWENIRRRWASHNLLSVNAWGNCHTELYPDTQVASGLTLIRWGIVCVLDENSGPCPECTGSVDLEGRYKSEVVALTDIGWSCWPLRTNRAEALAADWARLEIQEENLFFESAGAQSGDNITTTIGGTIGGEAGTSQQDGHGSKVTVNLTSTETRNVNTGGARDFINAFAGSTSNTVPGHAALLTGGKVVINAEGRGIAGARVTTEATGIWGVLTSDCLDNPRWFYSHWGKDGEQVSLLRQAIINFYAARGIPAPEEFNTD